MAYDAHTNGAYSTVLTAPSPASSGTSLVVQSSDGTRFPAVPFNATVWPAGVQPLFANGANAEIVRVTTISTDTFTITRTQESTSARSIIVGDQIAATITAKTITDIEGNIPNGAWTAYTPTYANLTVGNGTHQSYYTQLGKTVIARIGFTFGTTSTMGTAPTFTLPVASNSNYTDGEWIGGMRYVAGAAGFNGYVQWHTTTTAFLIVANASGTYSGDSNPTSTVPGTWTTGNTLMGTITYEVA